MTLRRKPASTPGSALLIRRLCLRSGLRLPVQDRPRVDSEGPPVDRIFDLQNLIVPKGLLKGRRPRARLDIEPNFSAADQIERKSHSLIAK
jgi:hypothetical protein